VSEERTRAQIRIVGQWRRVRITVLVVLVLAAVQWPMRNAVLEADPTWSERWGAGVVGGVPGCVVPARLSLLVDVIFIYAYVLAAWRAREFICVRAPWSRVLSRVGSAGAGLVSLAAVLDVAENVVVWQRFGASPGTSGGSACPSLEVATLSPVMWLTWLAGVLVVCGAFLAAVVSRRSTGDAEPPDPRHHDEGGQIICCSGGGIRSAAFSLGALQYLTEVGEYHKSTSVIGVSGGGYMAAAFHILRRSLTGRAGEPPPFAIGTPELARLRRHTNYLMPSVSAGARGIMSLLYGAVVNLVLIGVGLRLVSWVLGWAIAEVGVVDGLGTPDASVDFTDVPLWYWLGALGPLAFVVVLFLVEVVVDRFRVPPNWLRTEGRAFAQAMTLPGFLAAGLLIGMPMLLVAANDYGQSQVSMRSSGAAGPDGAGDTGGLMADLANGVATGLANAASSVAGIGATGADTALDSQFGFATLAALGAAFLALARSAWKGLETFDSDADARAGGGPADRTGAVGAARAAGAYGVSLRTRLVRWARTTLVPWLGSALLLLAGLVVLSRWTAGYVASEEWRARWWVAGVCGVLVLLVAVFTDATRTSLHPYYRERLSTAYLVRRTGPDSASTYDYAMPMPYSSWGGATDGGPQLTIVASANAFDREFIPPDRGCVPFVFDPAFTGVAGDVTLPSEGLESTSAYEVRADHRQRDVTIAGAVAISGAAFAPLTGRENARTRPMRLLFAVVNARLGVWLPNPYWGSTSIPSEFARRWLDRAERGGAGLLTRLIARVADQWAHLASVADKPGAYRLFKEAVGRTSLYDRRLYVTDGGHYDNLGLVEALRRRPRRIVVIDASLDPEDSFATVGSAIATARMDLGVNVSFDPRQVQRHDGDRVERGWVRGLARYPDGGEAEILLVKAMLAGHLSWDVEAYALRHGDFPLRSTGDQIYGEFDFEAYRALGYTLTKDMCAHARPRGAVPAGESVTEREGGTETDTVPAAEREVERGVARDTERESSGHLTTQEDPGRGRSPVA
jgi:hypothetical protein